MEFTLLFAAISSLSFTVQFDVEHNKTSQDFFLFAGENRSAHLHRENKTLLLDIVEHSVATNYQAECIEENFNFTWQGFSINNSPMNSLRNNTSNDTRHIQPHYIHYTFLSPVFYSTQCLADVRQPEAVATNYLYISAVALIIGVMYKSGSFIGDKLDPNSLHKKHGDLIKFMFELGNYSSSEDVESQTFV